jgi:hypothetical protein
MKLFDSRRYLSAAFMLSEDGPFKLNQVSDDCRGRNLFQQAAIALGYIKKVPAGGYQWFDPNAYPNDDMIEKTLAKYEEIQAAAAARKAAPPKVREKPIDITVPMALIGPVTDLPEFGRFGKIMAKLDALEKAMQQQHNELLKVWPCMGRVIANQKQIAEASGIDLKFQSVKGQPKAEAGGE